MKDSVYVEKAVYDIRLTAEEPLHVGGKPDPLSGAHNPVAMVNERPVIPGSSLKGAFRAVLERYLIQRFYDPQQQRWQPGKDAWKPCIPGAEVSPDEQAFIAAGKYANRNGSCHYPCDLRRGNHGGKHPICPACYLLGCQGLVGFVSVPMLTADNALASQLYSARIDRGTGTVSERANRPYHLVPDGAIFTGTLYVLLRDPYLDWELGKERKMKRDTFGDQWLAGSPIAPEDMLRDFIEGRFPEICEIGGFKSKGFGKVKIEVARVDAPVPV